MAGALLDTSILIGPSGTDLPNESAISVITVGELRAGVQLARSSEQRRNRQARLDAVRRVFEPLPVDEAVAEHYGGVLAASRRAGRTEKATDLLIAATALATGRDLHTLDEKQARLARHVGLNVTGA